MATVEEEYEKLRDKGYLSDDERMLAARVNASKPAPALVVDATPVLPQEDGHYWPQRFKDHPQTLLKRDYVSGDKVYCLTDDGSFFVLPANASTLDNKITYPDGRTWTYPRCNLIDEVTNERCSYCGNIFPAPLDLSHSEEECDSLIAAAEEEPQEKATKAKK